MKGLPSKGFSLLILCNFIQNWYNAIIDCQQRTILFVADKKFTAAGKFIGFHSYENRIPTNIKLDSNGAIYYYYLCN